MVYTNTIQAMLMIIVAIILISSGSSHFEQGITGFWDKINAIDPQLSKVLILPAHFSGTF